MLRLLLLASFLAAPCAFAQTDGYVHYGGLRGAGDTTWSAGVGFISKRSDHFGIGFGHLNEGHLPNSHRDGFYAQGWYLKPLGHGFELQVGTGPYASMDNATVDGVRDHDYQMGLLTSAALKWRPKSVDWYLRLQYNYVFMPGRHDSNAVLLGAGRDYDSPENGSASAMRLAKLGLWGGYSRTTQVGPQESAIAYELEAKFPLFDRLAYSVGLLWEGDTVLSNRMGVPIRLWYDQTATDRLMFGFGVGPYPSYNSTGDEGFLVAGILSIRFTYLAVDRYEVGFMYSRVASLSDDRDQDILMFGVQMRL